MQARLVAAATHSLVESANWLVQGQASEEKLISSAKQVASSTAQLLVACKVSFARWLPFICVCLSPGDAREKLLRHPQKRPFSASSKTRSEEHGVHRTDIVGTAFLPTATVAATCP